MSILIPVFNGALQGQQTQLVDARFLHGFLEVTSRFNDWITNRIKEYEFIEGQDFAIFTKNLVKTSRGRPSSEYHITLDMAKELSMIERTEKGRQARKYFIECEKRLQCVDMQELSHRLAYSRFVLAFDSDLKVVLQPLPNGCTMIAPQNARQLHSLINEMVPVDLLPDLLKTGIDRLSK